MTVDYCDPNGDVQKEWYSACPNHFQCIDGGIRQPTAPTDDNIAAVDGNESDIDRFYMDNSIQGVDEVTSIKVWIYGRNSTGERCSVAIQVGILEPWQGYQVVNMDGSYAWRSKTFNGSWTQANLDEMQVRFRAYSNYGLYDYTRIRAFYCEVTYSAAGYAHKFLGIASNRIGKVCGIPTTNVGKIKGV